MKLLDRYMLREMVVPFLIGQAAIVLMLTGTVLYNNADVLLSNQVPVRIIARMVLYFIPFLVHMTMPVAMAVAASLAVSRLGRDSEITVMRAAGVSLVRIFLPITIVGLLFSIGDFYFGEYVVPRSVDRFQAVLNEIPTVIPRLTPQAGRLIESSDQSYAIYVRTMIRRQGYIELHDVMLVATPQAVFNQEAEPLDIYAADGTYRNGMWTLEHYTMFIRNKQEGWVKAPPTPDGKFYLNVSVDPQVFQSGFLLQLPMWKMAGSSSRTFSELGDDIKRNKALGIKDTYQILDYHFKLSIPFSCLVMALCCPPMALRFARGGGFMGTLLSICLVFVYWNTMLLMRILGSPGATGTDPLLMPPLAAWSQNVAFVLLGLFVLRRSE
ncbi:MAG TPA: LptF/LptG family permease [Chthonomonadaceae bacterium]|nr:LptF/LptG family permease [Chthonomonadaceae bacterium]